MTFFFVGQRVRIIKAPRGRELEGVETTIVAEVDHVTGEHWILDVVNPADGHQACCTKVNASEYIAPAIPPEEAVEEEYLELTQ